jgi:formamidopyrimidine-DNA glycosylase
MPELPEVELVRRTLLPQVCGRQIRALIAVDDRNVFLTRPRVLQRRLAGRRIAKLEREGKYLLLALDDQQCLVLHLGMTGQLFIAAADGTSQPRRVRRGPQRPAVRAPAVDPHTHLRVVFADRDPELRFRDARKFGKVLLLRPGEHHARLSKLGVDALEASGADLYAATRKRSAWIKNLLLDQSVLAGIGNIYADEALFRSGIRPTRRAAQLTRAQCDALVGAVRRVMLASIRRGGTTVSDYLNADGRRGSYQAALRVYGRGGEPCRRCASPIVRRVLSQRSAHYCRRCQK